MRRVTGKSKWKGKGVSKAQIFNGKCGSKLEFQGELGWRE